MNPVRRRRLASGKRYANMAAHFTAASAQSLSIADNASLSAAGTGSSLSLACWAKFDTVTSGQCMIGKLASATVFEYQLNIETNGGPVQPQFFVSNNGSAFTRRFATTFGVPAAGDWHFYACWYDSVAQTLNIQVDNGAVDTTASYTTGIVDGTAAFRLGSNGVPQNMNGAVDSAGLWKKALSASEIGALYKGGVGMAYSDLSGSLLTSLSGWWNLDSDGNDSSVNGNHLTNNNNVTFVAGKR